MAKPSTGKNEHEVRLEVDEGLFPRTVTVSAAYRFVDRCYVRLERLPRRHLLVLLKGKGKLTATAMASLHDEFQNELLHQLMRHQVAERTQQLREILVGRALLSAEPVTQEGEEMSDVASDQSYLDDPLGIAVPWEEKYGDGKEKE